MLTRSLPPAGVQRSPAVKLSSPSGGGGGGGAGAGGGGSTIGPKSCQAVQPPTLLHCLAYIVFPDREKSTPCPAESPAATGGEPIGVASTSNQPLQPFTESQWFW